MVYRYSDIVLFKWMCTKSGRTLHNECEAIWYLADELESVAELEEARKQQEKRLNELAKWVSAVSGMN